MFDEVYHAFTAQQLFKNNPAAWEWWNTPPPGFAYEWTHPPLAKEFMVLAIYIFGDTSFAWRFFSALFSTLSIVLIYLITLKLFKNRMAAALAAFFASLDGLLLVMGRIAMNDSYFVFFSLLSIYLYLSNRKILMAISLGLAISSKWTAVFVIVGILLFEFYKLIKKNFSLTKHLILNPLFLFIIPLIVYLVSYLPFFLSSHVPPGTSFNNLESFIELQRQMFYYHTNLDATHPYQSIPFDWIFNLRPVWLFVEYRGDLVSNVYTLGSPLYMWGGLFSVLVFVYYFFKKRSFEIFVILISYLLFFLPWSFSPRIMFNYHYLLSASFLAIAQGVFILSLLRGKYRIIAFAYLILAGILFIYFYPLWTGVAVDKNLFDSYFWLKSWK
jgi:dolichyl-phosphate-mannose-protein mannosyltransferase